MFATRLLTALLLLNCGACFGEDWRGSINARLDDLASQLNDGCSSEVRAARKIYEFGSGEGRVYAGLISIEGQYCGNNNIEYLAVYRPGFARPNDDQHVAATIYWLAAFAIVGGRGQRVVDFGTLEYSDTVFSVSALAYENDPMCCPSRPIVLKYKLSTFGLLEVQPDTSLERTRGR